VVGFFHRTINSSGIHHQCTAPHRQHLHGVPAVTGGQVPFTQPLERHS
jgi:hypothetical protein